MTTYGATFTAHAGASIVTRQQLAGIDTPPSTPTWRPIGHAELVDLIEGRLHAAGYRIAREQYAVQKEGLWFFGAIDLAGGSASGEGGLVPVTPGAGLALGFQHSNDKKLALRIVAGARVFVCDNMALSGDREVFRNMHTHGVMGRLRESVGAYFGGLEAQAEVLRKRFAAWQASSLTDTEAKALIYDGLAGAIIPHRIRHEVHKNYFDAEALGFEDSAPRSKWGLHNACTRAFKALNPGPMFEANFGLTTLLDGGRVEEEAQLLLAE
jgi:hypothetical protein